MMKIIISSIAFVLIASIVFAGDLKVKVDNKNVVLKKISINHEIKKTDRDKGGRNSALDCSLLYYSLLAKDDIQAASKLEADPVKAADKWSKYKERIGKDDFKKIMEDYFTSGNVILAELVLGEDSILVLKTEDGIAGQFYRKKDGKYFVIGMPFSDTADTLGKVLTMIQDGEVKL
jgi:hypothetical protein